MDLRKVFTETELKELNELLEVELVALTSKIIGDFCLSYFTNNKFELRFQAIAFHHGRIPILSGSTAEFYIRPVVSCTGDIDMMTYNRDLVVRQDKTPLVLRKSYEMMENMKCFRLVPADRYPAFAYLELDGEFRYSWDLEKYIFYKDHSCPPKRIYSSYPPARQDFMDYRLAGPALNMEANMQRQIPNWVGYDLDLTALIRMSMDGVMCYHCMFWPDSALEWKSRKRLHGSPNQKTIDAIVQAGCDVVRVSHHSCREDEYMVRMSFSRAEITLIRRWTHSQQIVFHELRYFAKHELMPDEWERTDKILCTYHIKTLMMWANESEPKEFWENPTIQICCSLLKTLSKWLEKKVCQNYFIPDCNLFSHISNKENLEKVINRISEFENSQTLADWFQKNYIPKSKYLKLSMLCESLKLSVGLSTKFQKYACDNEESLSKVAALPRNLRREMEKYELTICLLSWSSFHDEITELLTQSPVNSLPRCLSRKIACDAGKHFVEFSTAVQILMLAKHLTANTIPLVDYQVFDYIGTLYKTFEVHDFPITYYKRLPLNRVYFIKAEELMSGLSSQISDHEDRLLTELSIQCLEKSMGFEDSIKDDSYSVSTVYLAALYFKRKQYQMTIELCSSLIDKEVSTKKKAKGRLLLFIKDVANIFGLISLWKYGSHCSVTSDDSGDVSFTPKIFALYLLSLCSWTRNIIFEQHTPISDSSQQTTADRFLWQMISSRTGNQSSLEISLETSSNVDQVLENMQHSRLSETEIIELLMEIYCERLAVTFEMVRRDFDPNCISDVALKALYRYRCRQYDAVLSICDRLINTNQQLYHTMDCMICHPAFLESVTLPVDLFFDDDIQAVIGFGLLVQNIYKRSPFLIYPKKDKPNLPEYYHENEPTIEEMSKQNVKFFFKTAFLAKYLTLRCYLDLGRPMKEILKIYRQFVREIRTSPLPERVLICFLGQKLRRILKQNRSVRRPYLKPEDQSMKPL